MDEQMDGQIDR